MAIGSGNSCHSGNSFTWLTRLIFHLISRRGQFTPQLFHRYPLSMDQKFTLKISFKKIRDTERNENLRPTSTKYSTELKFFRTKQHGNVLAPPQRNNISRWIGCEPFRVKEENILNINFLSFRCWASWCFRVDVASELARFLRNIRELQGSMLCYCFTSNNPVNQKVKFPPFRIAFTGREITKSL